MPEMDEMEYLSKVDFTKGFQSFHIKWPIGKFEFKASKDFNTTVTDGDKTTTIRWRLIISEGDVPGRRFGLFLLSEMTVPTVRRILLERTGCGRAKLDSSFRVLYHPDTIGWGFSIMDQIAAKLVDNDYMIHCWIDIPKGILLMDPDIKIVDENSCKIPSQVTTYQRQMAQLFDGVLTGDRNSDITLAIMKEKVKESQASKSAKLEKVVRRFYCHHLILTTRCAVFESMFSGKWKESKGEEIEIKEIDPDAMEAMLRYIYTSDLPDKASGCDHLSNIIFAADEYCLDELKDHCVISMISKDSSNDERIEQLRVADRHNLDQLKAVCLSQLSLNLQSISTPNISGRIGLQLFAEISQEAGKRQIATTVINLA